MPIERDDKDWTWVLERRCPECGLEVAAIEPADVGQRLRDQLPVWRSVLSHDGATLRPDEGTWSATEYACHVRDVCTLYARRLLRMLTENDPEYPNWSSDDAAVDGRYGDQAPTLVITQLETELAALADAFDAVHSGQWARPGQRSDGAVFTVASFSRYLLHDVVHHGWDVTRERRI